MSSKILLRRGTAAQWASANPILGSGELGVETDTLKFKIGNGTSTWTQLTSYANVTPSQLTSEINNLINAAPSTLDTLNELAAAINNDASFSTTVNNLLTGKVSKSGGDTITPSTTSTIGLTLASPAGQTGHLLYAAGGTRIPAGGNYLVTPGLTVSYTSDFNAGAANITPIYVKGAASQTADLQQWKNFAGDTLVSVTSSGHLSVSDRIYGGNGVSIYNASSFGSPSLFPPFTYDSIVNISTVYAGAVGLVIRGVASQTNDLQQWRNSAGTVLVKIASDGTTTFSGGYTLINQYGEILTTGSRPLGIGGTLFTNTVVSIQPTLTNLVGIAVRGAASQTANLQEWQNSAGTVKAYVNVSGDASFGSIATGYYTPYSGAFSANALLYVNTNAAGNRGIVVDGWPSQTADLQQWRNSSGTVLANVDANGVFILKGFNSGYNFINIGGNVVNSALINISPTNNIVPILIRGVSGQTANLQEWQNSAGYAGTAIDSGGSFYAPGIYASYLMQVTSGGAAVVPMKVKGAASQTADLQQWQDSAGTVLASLSPAISSIVTLKFTEAYSWNINWGNRPILSTASAYLTITPYDDSRIALIVKGYASQTANLQEWQNSAGTVLNAITSSGTLVIGGTTPVNSSFGITIVNKALASYYSPNNSVYNSSFNFARGNTTGNWMSIGTIGDSANGVSSIAISNSSSQSLFTVGQTGNTAILLNSASTVGLTVKGFASQTANLQEWQNSSGTTLAYMSTNGHLVAQRVYAPDSLYVVANGGPGTVNIETYSFAAVGIIVKGKTSQTADLQQWQNSAGSVVASIANTGSLTTGNLTLGTNGLIIDASSASPYIAFGSNTITINTRNAAYKGLIVQGAASQTANLQEWQSSSGEVGMLFNMGNAGNPSTLGFSVSRAWGIKWGAEKILSTDGGSLIVTPYTTDRKVLIVKGVASQTADLQQWQNSSGTVLAKVDASGSLELNGKDIELMNIMGAF